jgi:hypothetical protein
VAAGGLVLDIAGAVILALGLVLKTSTQTLDESTPRHDFNAVLDASLASQVADAQVGATLLVLGFGAQLAAALGWDTSSSRATALTMSIAAAGAVGAWSCLRSYWRPSRTRDLLVARLRASEMGLWWPLLAAYGSILKIAPLGDSETIAAYGERVLGHRRWRIATHGIQLPPVMTRLRTEVPGTPEYEAAQRRNSSTS